MKLTLSILAIITILFIDFIKALQFKHLFGKKRERERRERKGRRRKGEKAPVCYFYYKSQ